VHVSQLRDWVKKFADDPQHAFPGHGQMKPEQLEIARLKREVAKLKAERDILKHARRSFSSCGHRNELRYATTATFSFETGHTTLKSINWGRAGEQLSSGLDYRKDDIIRVAQQLLSKLPR
jgi:hypothetical protein